MGSLKAMKRCPTPDEIFASELITIKVGPAAREYRAHKVLLTHYSGYFRGALGSTNFEEGRTGVVTLADVDTYSFVVYLKWLYCEELPDLPWWKSENLGHPHESINKAIVMTYIFADRFLVPELAKCTSKILFNSIHRSFACEDAVEAAFESLHSENPLLRMLVDSYCLSWSPNQHLLQEEELGEQCLSFYRRLAHRLSETRDGSFTKLKYSDYKEPEIEDLERDGEPPRKKVKAAA